MGRKVGGADVGQAIVDALREYTDAVSEAIRKEVDDAANDIKQGIQAGSPVGTSGDYKKGWGITKRDTKGVCARIVHNKRVPGLAHLLEHGHAKRGGGRVSGRPHIAPVTEARVQKMEENIKRIIENGG